MARHGRSRALLLPGWGNSDNGFLVSYQPGEYMRQPLHLRIFISSPGDVSEERALARELIRNELPVDPFIRGKATFDVVSWDDPHAPKGMAAHLTPQEAINRGLPLPSACDFVIVLLWKRMGTPLKLNGESFLSGTEWEYKNARDAAKKHGRPFILVYRRRHSRYFPSIQYRRVKQFFEGFTNSDGSISGAFHPYSKPGELQKLLRYHLKEAIRDRLEDEPFNDVFDGIPQPEGFVGRDTEIAQIHKHFFPEGAEEPEVARKAKPPRKPCRVLIHAGPGFGKTSLARKYAHEFRDYFHLAYGIASEQKDSLLSRIVQLGRETDRMDESLPGTNVTLKDAANALKSRLDDIQGPCLLLFDNVDPSTALTVRDLFVALPPNVRVISTARFANWDENAKPVELAAFDAEEAAGLLRDYANKDDIAGSLRLARKLGGLPLALSHAGKLCMRFQQPFSEYEEKLDSQLKKTPVRHDYIKKTSEGAEFAPSVHATVMLGLEAAAEDSAARENLTRLSDFLSYCSADGIPRSLFSQAVEDKEGLDGAIGALQDVGLVQRDKEFLDRGDPSVSMHRLVQRIIRDDADSNGRSPGVIDRLVPFLYEQLKDIDAENASGDNKLRFSKYFPHLLQVLPKLDAPDFRGNEQNDILDDVAKLIVLALTRQYDDEEAYPEGLPGLLGCFYEVDPLAEPLNFLLRQMHGRPEKDWHHFRDECLSRQNYVLRFALASALSAAVDEKLYDSKEITQLVKSPLTLNHFELGGYALKSLYSDPESYGGIDPALLGRLAGHRCYPGRSILGDLLLNLVYQKRDVLQLLPEREGKNERFWQPVWDFVAFDVNAIRAADYYNNGQTVPAWESEEVKTEYAYLLQLESWRSGLLERFTSDSVLLPIVTNYFSLGVDTAEISRAKDAFAALNADSLLQLVRLLFGHPLWSVAESAASVVAALLRRAKSADGPRETNEETRTYIDLVEALFAHELPWRVRYGAMEAAFQIRLDEEQKHDSFFKGVEMFYADTSSKMRGLCAENLLSIMLNSNGKQRINYEARFEREIRWWLKDEDCWVLEHVHRYFHALHERNVDVSGFMSGEQSPLVSGLDKWWTAGRETFLEHIENQKEQWRQRIEA